MNLLKPYTGSSDPRSTIAFVHEFEQMTEHITDDAARRHLFTLKFDLQKFPEARTYIGIRSYILAREKFLATQWSEMARERMIHEIDYIK